MARKNKNKKKQAGPKQSPAALKMLSAPHNKCCLSQAASDWVKLVYDPESGPLVGIPDGEAFLTRKIRPWARGTYSSGNGTPTNDLTFTFNPLGFLANDQYVLQVGPPTAAQSMPALGAAGSSLVSSNVPFASSDFASFGVQGRVVSAGLKIRYLGTNLNEGGLVYMLQEPQHNTMVGESVSKISSYVETTKTRVKDLKPGLWHTLIRTVADGNDLKFIDTITRSSNINGVYTSDGVTCGKDAEAYMVSYISVPVASTPFEYEVWGVVEYTGRLANPKTLTVPDPQGFKIALAALASVNANSAIVGSSSVSQSEKKGLVDKKATEILDKSLPQTVQGYLDMASQAFTRYGPSMVAAAKAAGTAYQAIRGSYARTPEVVLPTRVELID